MRFKWENINSISKVIRKIIEECIAKKSNSAVLTLQSMNALSGWSIKIYVYAPGEKVPESGQGYHTVYERRIGSK